MYDQGAELDLEQVCVEYLRERGWQVESRKPQFYRDRKGVLQTYGDRDALWWHAMFPVAPGLQYTFRFHARVKPLESDARRREWMKRRIDAGELCRWFTSREQFLNWYLDNWAGPLKADVLGALGGQVPEFENEPKMKAMVVT